MQWRDAWANLSLSRLDYAAIACAALLSIGCLIRGAVYDGVVALLILTFLPVAALALSAVHSFHLPLLRIATAVLAVVGVVLALQQLLPASGKDLQLWHQVTELTGMHVRTTSLLDKSAWFNSLGRVILLILVGATSLAIGSSESSARIFLQSLLISSAACVTLTFFIATGSGVTDSPYNTYQHGFVNPNNAASYLGVLLLLALAQAVRFFRRPHKAIRKVLPDLIDELNIPTLLKSIGLLFTMLLAMGGLFMTGSRGGIFVCLLSAAMFVAMVIFKIPMRSRLRRLTVMGGCSAVLLLMVWSFLNFGQGFVVKMKRDGLDHHARLEVYEAILPMINDHPLLGVGLGAFPTAFQQYRPDSVPSDGIIDKAHNSYLEFAAEMGLPAAVLLMGALGWAAATLLHGVLIRKERYVNPALGTAVLFLAATHSLIDFPLQIPALAALFLSIVMVCVCQTDPRFSEPTHSGNTHIRRVRIRKRGSSQHSTAKPA